MKNIAQYNQINICFIGILHTKLSFLVIFKQGWVRTLPSNFSVSQG